MSISHAYGITVIIRFIIFPLLIISLFAIAFYTYKKRYRLKTFLQDYGIYFVLGLLVLVITAFALNYITENKEDNRYEKGYVDFNTWKEKSICSEALFESFKEGEVNNE